MAAAVACILAGAALGGLRLVLDHLRERDALRHRWRMELVEARGTAYRAETLEELRQRVQKLELRTTR